MYVERERERERERDGWLKEKTKRKGNEDKKKDILDVKSFANSPPPYYQINLIVKWEKL